MADGENNYFEHLMNQFSEPDQLFGPLDLQELKKGVYVIKTEGYLPRAQIAFLDEIWKANPAIQNTLLAVLNEKKFHNGSKAEDVPLLFFICASNELPAETKEQNQSLKALWDRITVRLHLTRLRDVENFKALLNSPAEQCQISQPISVECLKELRGRIDAMPLGALTENLILHMRQKLHDLEEEIFVSDRRWLQVGQLIRAAALVNGHEKPDIIDCGVMLHSLWDKEEDREVIRQLWSDILQGHAIASELDTEELEQKIANYHQQIEEHYTEEERDLLVDQDGFIPLAQGIKWDNQHFFTAIHQDSWKELQDNPQNFQQNWWHPTVRLQDGTVWESNTNTYCKVAPQETYRYQTKIISTYNSNWQGPMALQTQKTKDASFDTDKFLQANKSVESVTENKKLFVGWDELFDNISREIVESKRDIQSSCERESKSYSNNHFLCKEDFAILTEPAAERLRTLESLRLKTVAIHSEYQEAFKDTKRVLEEIRKSAEI